MTAAAGRHAGLRQLLIDRRRESEDDGRAGQGDVEVALRGMRADTRARVDAALVRLDAGTYGTCVECEGAIAERRLRGLPFALRCGECEERRTLDCEEARQRAQGRSTLPLFSEMA